MNSFLEIDINVIDSNIKKISRGKKSCIMLKANYYGCGPGIIGYLFDKGYDFFGVSILEEALEIKNSYPTAQVLVVAKIPSEQIDIARKNDVIVTLVDFENLHLYKNARIHVKIDVGMNRLGFKKNELIKLKSILEKKEIVAEGIFSHLPFASDEAITLKQASYFHEQLKYLDYDFKWVHLQNSMGAIKYDFNFTNMIRPGIAILGYFSTEKEKCSVNFTLKEALKYMAFVEQKKPCEGYVGYDLTTFYKGNLATLRVGYHDGFSRSLNGFEFNSGNKIIGNICMCQMMISDVGNVEKYFEMFGEVNSIYKLAEFQKKIIYEILVSISNRILRKYIN